MKLFNSTDLDESIQMCYKNGMQPAFTIKKI